MDNKYDDLVKLLREWPRVCQQYEDSVDQLRDQAAGAIEELQADKAALNGTVTNLLEQIKNLGKPRWIPVTERLPEKNGTYLVYVYGEVTEMNCWHGKWHRLGDDYTKAVSHWMPLPKPPKTE